MIRLVIPEIGDDDIAAVAEALRSGYLVQGERVRAFEQRTADYLDVRHAVAVSSGTAALHLAVLALGLGSGDEVIVPDFTFPATANVVDLVGATPVLVDVDLATFNVDVARLRDAITPRTRAIMPVHLFGLSADMAPILALADQHGLAVIEDAACALGAEFNGRKCGTMGTVGCFSYHPRKAITTGEGGMLVTNDDDLAERVRLLRAHGMASRGGMARFEIAGLNYRLTEFQGALGTTQMAKLERVIARRTAVAESYDTLLADVPSLTRPATPAGYRHVWQSYVVLLDDAVPRDEVMRAMRARGVETTIGTHAVSAQPHYAGERELANARSAYRRTLSLPMHARLSADDVAVVADALADTMAARR